MPLFDFTCQDCGKQFDKLFRTLEQKPAAPCPACGSKNTRRALSLVNTGESKGGASDAAPPPPGICGRCGVPGPCAN